MTERRQFLKAGAALAAVGPALVRADERPRLWQGRDFGPAPAVSDRLDQGPFGIEQDEGWYTIATTTPDPGRVRNPGLGLVGYTWEENGPSLAARSGQETLEQSVEQLAALPFVDVLYVRCDWRDVQSRPGRLDLHPVFALTRDAARRRGRRFAFRVQLSSRSAVPSPGAPTVSSPATTTPSSSGPFASSTSSSPRSSTAIPSSSSPTS
jgi:hypothetical protein